jgi:prefoldin alpha subunit
MDEKEIQEKVVAYRLLESRLNGLVKQREAIASKLIEIENTLAGIEEFEKSDEILFPIGAEAYVPGKITDKNKIIVEVGAGVVMEKTLEEAKGILNKRKEDIIGLLQNIQKDMMTTSSHMDQLGSDIQTFSGESEGTEAG